MEKQSTYLLVPLPKSPYYRVGPLRWQDWYRQVVFTAAIARKLRSEGKEVVIAVISDLHPKGKLSEIEIYAKAFRILARELHVVSCKETNDTLGQVEKSLELAKEMNAELIFISAWMQFPRIVYLARGIRATHYGVFGIPSPIFAIEDPVAMIFQPVIIFLGLGKLFQRLTVSRREKGTIW